LTDFRIILEGLSQTAIDLTNCFIIIAGENWVNSFSFAAHIITNLALVQSPKLATVS